MDTLVLDTNSLPLLIREKFHTSKVAIQELDDGKIILLPLNGIGNFRGIAKGSTFTSEKLFEYRRMEKELEDRGSEK